MRRGAREYLLDYLDSAARALDVLLTLQKIRLNPRYQRHTVALQF